MPRTDDELALTETLIRHYRVATRAEVLLEIEQELLGCDYGGTSWTNREEAQRFSKWLGLGPGVRALELGAGCGWPGLYLAKLTGCDMTLTDLPREGLLAGMERAVADGLADRCRAVVASGASLPFAAARFDAIHHSDVLCWLVPKLSVLRACRRVITDSGRMVFGVISYAPGVTTEQRERVTLGAPPCTDSPAPYPELLDQSGWEIVEQIDMTEKFGKAARLDLEIYVARSERLEALLGAEELAERMTRRQERVVAVDQNWLRRELFVTRPAPT